MLAGLAGVFLPILPGLPLVWLGLFIYAIGTGFETISIAAVVIFAVVDGLAMLIDFLAPLLGLKKYNASKFGYIGAFVGFVVGLIFFSFWGALLGPLVGSFVGELAARRSLKRGSLAFLSAFVGTILGSLLRTVIGLIIVGYFIASFF
jgi:uncharacterized protein